MSIPFELTIVLCQDCVASVEVQPNNEGTRNLVVLHDPTCPSQNGITNG